MIPGKTDSSEDYEETDSPDDITPTGASNKATDSERNDTSQDSSSLRIQSIWSVYIIGIIIMILSL